jgi:hypothetical protein
MQVCEVEYMEGGKASQTAEKTPQRAPNSLEGKAWTQYSKAASGSYWGC